MNVSTLLLKMQYNYVEMCKLLKILNSYSSLRLQISFVIAFQLPLSTGTFVFSESLTVLNKCIFCHCRAVEPLHRRTLINALQKHQHLQ